LSAAQCVESGVAVYPGIAYSVDPYGLSWYVNPCSLFSAWASSNPNIRGVNDVQTICAVSNGDLSGSNRIVALFWVASGPTVVYVAKTDDNGSNWENDDAFADASEFSRVKYINGSFVVTTNTSLWYGDGTSWTEKNLGATALRDVAFNGDDLWIAVENDSTVWYSDSLTGTWTSVSLPITNTGQTNFIQYDSIGERFIVNSDTAVFWSTDGITWATRYINSYGEQGSVKRPTNMIEDFGAITSTLFDGGADYVRNLVMTRYDYYFWDIIDFIPISDIYRSSTFSVLDGYTVLIGTREYDEDTGVWT